MTSTLVVPVTGRSLIAADLFNRLSRQIVKDYGRDQDTAERIMDQTLLFLKACADHPDRVLRPSRAIDEGWHTFILNTLDYAEFCEQIAGRFLHHTPEEFTPPGNARDMLAPTVLLLRMTGVPVDETLWAQSGSCSQCHSGCTDCGQGGGKCR